MTKSASADRIETATSAVADEGGAVGIAATAADEAVSAVPGRKPATRAATPRSSAPRKTGSGGSKARKPSVTAADGLAPAGAGTKPKARSKSVKSVTSAKTGVEIGAKNKIAAKRKSAVTPGAVEVALDGDGDGASEPKKRRGPPSGTLVIVESPAKAKTIKKYLGAGFVVKASVGHVKDLPKKKIGIDIEHDFQPEYVVIEGKKKVLDEITTAAGNAERVLLAPDPDREGEAIAWHLAEEVRGSNSNIFRVLFNEITKKAVTEAILHPIALDIHKFESQQARRILDRLVGYQISPVLWTKVKRGLSAGRVQSVAVRLVVEREDLIAAFKPEEYWTVEATLEGKAPPPFTAKVVRLDGAKVDLSREEQARAVVESLREIAPRVASIERKERRKNPPPPFITSKLQQEASSKLRFSPKRTMGLAQRLYEGVEMGDEGPVGLITYMRTDSTRISDDALLEVRELIGRRYGGSSLPPQPIVYKTKKQAQDAHEAIRPTSMKYDPDTVRKLWAEKGGGRDERESDDLLRLYTLIWNRFVACQMVPAVFDQTTIEIEAGRVGLRATGQVMKFAGFLEVYAETVEDAVNEDEASGALPGVEEGEILRLLAVDPQQHFTQPPPRFSEATLVKELEEKGIGRPSTYAAILSTIQERGYAEKKEGRLHPTELGGMVNTLLVKSFPEIVSTDFTAQMEEQLDQVEEGQADWVKLLRRFYEPFKLDLEKAKIEMRDLKREEQPTDQICEKCGKSMVIKWGRNGHFLACTGYPECRNTKEYTKRADGSIEIVSATRPTDQLCPNCGSPMVIRRGRFGEFQACSRYPECKTTSPISLGVACPKPDCGGYLTEKRSKRGKVFYGCSNYSKTKCDFVSWDRPIPQPCPQCGAAFLVQKVSKAGTRIRCIKEGCDYTADPEANDPSAGEGSGTGAGVASA